MGVPQEKNQKIKIGFVAGPVGQSLRRRRRVGLSQRIIIFLVEKGALFFPGGLPPWLVKRYLQARWDKGGRVLMMTRDVARRVLSDGENLDNEADTQS